MYVKQLTLLIISTKEVNSAIPSQEIIDFVDILKDHILDDKYIVFPTPAGVIVNFYSTFTIPEISSHIAVSNQTLPWMLSENTAFCFPMPIMEIMNRLLKERGMTHHDVIETEKGKRVDETFKMSVDDLLDIVREKGFENLTPLQRNQLENLSKK